MTNKVGTCIVLYNMCTIGNGKFDMESITKKQRENWKCELKNTLLREI